MSSELERRLEGLLAEAPEPEAGAWEKALARALSALHPVGPRRRGIRTAGLVFAAGIVLLAIAAGSLAAVGTLHVSFSAKKAKPKPPEAPHALALPPGAAGVAAVVNGRLSVVIREGGFRLRGLPVTAAALSPHALYIAAGIGRSLVALRPDGSQAWSHRSGGRLVAIAWAPDGLRIAYLVRSGGRLALHVIWGNGTHDTPIEGSVRAVRPSWRADSLAFAYVGAGGKAVVYDLGHESRSVAGPAAPVARLAFAPVGDALLIATPESALLDGKKLATGEIEAIGWLHDRPAVALEQGVRPPLVRTFGASGRTSEGFRITGRVIGITGGLVVTKTAERILAGRQGKQSGTILGVSRTTSVEDLAIG